ncbi:unnamed protein product [Ectocarpus sp. 6 AP-2014]
MGRGRRQDRWNKTQTTHTHLRNHVVRSSNPSTMMSAIPSQNWSARRKDNMTKLNQSICRHAHPDGPQGEESFRLVAQDKQHTRARTNTYSTNGGEKMPLPWLSNSTNKNRRTPYNGTSGGQDRRPFSH